MIQKDLLQLACPINQLTLLPGNPRRGDVDAVKASLERFGQRKPIVVRKSDRVVIAGNHTLQAAQALGWSEIAVVWVDDDDAMSKAFALADNRTAELGYYDENALAALIGEVGALDPELLEATGWDSKSVSDLLDKMQKDLPVDVDEIPEQVPSISKLGDVWLLGDHRIMCGDCRNSSDVDKLMGKIVINVAFTSPPYADARRYDDTSDFKPIPPDEYCAWFDLVQANVASHLATDGSWFVNIKARADGLDTPLYVHDMVIAHVRQWGWHYATEFCWERIGMPKSVTRRFKNQFEIIYQFARGDWKMRPKAVQHESNSAIAPMGVGAGDTAWGDDMTQRGFDASRIGDGMAYPGNRLPPFFSQHTGHTAAFPVGLPTFFIKAFSDMGDVIYDPFMGSGTTLIASHDERRIAYGLEISPAYVDVICARFQKHTGVLPVLESDGLAHDFSADV